MHDPYKDRIRKLVELTNSEKRGMLFFLFLVLLILYLPKIADLFINDGRDLARLGVKVQQLKAGKSKNITEEIRYNFSMSLFDPNTSSVQELKDLGLPDYLAKRIEKYRLSGGQFKTADDLLKIYGLDEELYGRLKPFVSIKEKKSSKVRHTRNIFKKTHIKKTVILNLNETDSVHLLKIRGIGPVYASRIIKYRNALGGYYKVEQLREVYGIKDSLYQAIQTDIFIRDNSLINYLPINRISKKDLRSHPYFRSYNMCNAIINYRDQHGDFESLEDLKNIHVINDSIIEKIAPYLTFE